ncbi:MAG: hypothetical protein ACJ8F4_09600 [Sphingomonas sp.]
MVRLHPIALLALATWSSCGAANTRVSVTSAAQEQQARRLASALMKELRRDPRFTLVDQPQTGALNIALPDRVGWERRLDWTEILFQARLNASNGQSHVFAGRCYNWNMSACAKQLLDAAAQVAGN